MRKINLYPNIIGSKNTNNKTKKGKKTKQAQRKKQQISSKQFEDHLLHYKIKFKELNKEINIEQQNQIREATKFVDILNLTDRIKEMKKINFITLKYLQNCFKQIINWKNIYSEVKEHKQYKIAKKNINEEFNKILNADLEQFGLQIWCYDYYQYIVNNQKSNSIKFQAKNQIKSYQRENIFFQNLKKLNKFDQSIIQRNLKKNHHLYPQNSFLRLGSYKQYIFEVQNEYKNTKQLQKYISNQNSIVLSNLKSDAMKDFVFNELLRTKSKEKLFKNIDEIINKSSDYLTYEDIAKLFINVNQEIILFNDDLNQVSHKLTLLFVGYVHLYAIYLKWKKYSETALRQSNKPYIDMQKTRENRLKVFIKNTSNNSIIQSEGDSLTFLIQVQLYFEQIIKYHKQIINENEATLFKIKYPRAKIQEQIDIQCYGPTSTAVEWNRYLTVPAQVIKSKYQALTENSIKSLSIQYKKCEKVVQLLRQFKQRMQLLLNSLQKNLVNQDTIHTAIFNLQKTTQKEIFENDNKFLEDINGLIMNYFLDLLVGRQKEEYSKDYFKLKIKQEYKDIKIIKEPTEAFQSFVKRLMEQNMSITRFYSFVYKVNKKLQEKRQFNEVDIEIFQKYIQELQVVTQEDKEYFKSLVSTKPCQQLCPGCQRICGVEQLHTNKHQCIYGHQMRALGGVKLKNGDASVMRCEDIPLFSPIQYNGRQMTWAQFKNYWEAKQQGSWIFQDLKNDTKKQFFMDAWDIAGQQICKIKEMKYVRSNFLQRQISQMKPTHYIFALDDSGSMRGNKWNALMNSFAAAIQEIKNKQIFQPFVKISILVFNQQCIQFQENVSPSQVNLVIPFRSGLTSFANAFSKAYDLMQRYVQTSRIKFIFMSDGQDSYPSVQVNQIKLLKNQHPNKIEYFGIEFQEDVEVMKLISRELEGTNKISHSEAELTATYIEIINRKQSNQIN